MATTALKKLIFVSIPKTFKIGTTTYTVYVDYADRINVSERLASKDIVVSIRYFADTRDEKASSVNNLFSISSADDETTTTKGERVRETLSINVHAAGDTTVKAADLIDAYLADLMTWYLRDLPEVAGLAVVGRSGITDLAYLENMHTGRKQLDIFIAYATTYTETSGIMETIDYTVASS